MIFTGETRTFLGTRPEAAAIEARRGIVRPLRTMNKLPPLALALLAAACAAPRPPAPAAVVQGTAPFPGHPVPDEPNVPAYATRMPEAFSRANAIAVALREWRAFGQGVDDDPPDTRPPLGDARPDRQPGLWQRVGDYWFTGQEVGTRTQDWTSKYDGGGSQFPPGDDAHAWSAAFISYVMRVAGAGTRFPYSPTHARYINAAVEGGYAIVARRLTDYAPVPGDLVCMGRGRAAAMRFEDLPAPAFPAHCDMVVATAPGQDTVIGGNVNGSVTMKHVPVTKDGKLASPDGAVLDTRWPWLLAIQVLYDQ